MTNDGAKVINYLLKPNKKSASLWPPSRNALCNSNIGMQDNKIFLNQKYFHRFPIVLV
jgi:hypothetical protein